MTPHVSALAGRGRILGAIFLSIALAFIASSQGVDANDKRIISIYADGNKQTVSTRLATVEEVLDQANVEVGKYDLVEPSLDTQIIDDLFSVNVYRARPVTIIDGIDKYEVMSAYQSPRLIAESAGLTIYDEDEFTLERIDNILGEGALGQRLTIDRALPVTVSLYGSELTHRTQSNTVGEVLNEIGVALGENDELSHDLDDRVKEDITIAIARFGTQVETVEEDIPFEIEVIQDSNRMAGNEEIKEEGRNGRKLVTYEIELKNGEEVSRKEIESVVAVEPVSQVMIVGTKQPDAGTNVEIGQAMAAERGWVGGEWTCLLNLWQKESNWNHLAYNAGSGATGIPQALPGSKMASAGSDWKTNPRTQIKWGMGYIAGRYGTPCGAWSHSQSAGWY